MRSRAHWGTAVVVALAGFALGGDAPKTYDIELRKRWEAKQVVTFTVHEASDIDTSVAGNSPNKENKSLDAVYVVRCDEVAADGEPAKQTVFVRSWKAAKGAATDESLAGALVAVTGNEWKLESGKAAGALASKWLDKTFGSKRSTDPLEKIAPKQLTVGEPWKPDPKVVAESFARGMEDTPFDEAGVTMELVLESAEGTPPDASGKCRFKAHLPITKLPNLPPNTVVKAGSGTEITGTRTGPLTKSTMLGTVHKDTDLSMDIEVPGPQGMMSVVTKGKIVQDLNAVAGGEIPETKAPAAPPPGDK